MLVAVLIAIFAIGLPLPGQADCLKCDNCSADARGKSEAPCQHKGMACQIAQTCANQMQKAQAQLAIHPIAETVKATFSLISTIAIRSTYLTPETAPPRL